MLVFAARMRPPQHFLRTSSALFLGVFCPAANVFTLPSPGPLEAPEFCRQAATFGQFPVSCYQIFGFFVTKDYLRVHPDVILGQLKMYTSARLLLTIFCLASLMLALEGTAHAYADPGSGLLALQIIGSTLAGVGFYFRQKFGRLFARRRGAASSSLEEQEASSQPSGPVA